MIGLSLVALTYVAVARGRVEVLNLFELNRVGAIVWVGRPLLLARALTALSLLSTSTLQLVVQSSGLASFSVPTNAWYKTVLAANEVTWLAAVVNDVALVFTQEYSYYFITPNSVLVWLITAATSFAAPVDHDLRLAKSCVFGQVDFDVVCASATLTIGYLPRLALLCGIVVGCTVVSYMTTRLLLRRRTVTASTHSVLLYAGAKYLFATAKWVNHDDGVYYIDRMSASLNGLLTLRVGHTMYAFDIKLWRVFHVEVDDADDWAFPLFE
ncbi:Aste57867_16525 [Aphanomyces stellatus]|uniref:Aste57867_16525 protein n=1 Tax=Aphanomyces stellatus TaxID=120398 RepID=A0A485L602_9STRA|nr:hypothetical protein As57867_016468 [Aphanomyces stellatus]VFT93299.1 Aste57867_16525 [Aphanomyces stellatus]